MAQPYVPSMGGAADPHAWYYANLQQQAAQRDQAANAQRAQHAQQAAAQVATAARAQAAAGAALAQQQRQAAASKAAAEKAAAQQDAQDDEGVGQKDGVADTFADYEPKKVKMGRRHPDQTVETSSMSSVPPPDPTYTLKLPRPLIDKGLLSGLQLESLVYASMRHHVTLQNGRNERAGFLLGDGAGIGKGRQISGAIFENFRQGRKKSVWFSASADLAADAARDFADIGASNVPIINLPDMPYKVLTPLLMKKNGTDNGVLFSTYSCLISGAGMKRIDQLVKWCGEDFEGCLVFDECHKAKNLVAGKEEKSSRTARHVLAVQRRLPRARVIYVSATGASELAHMSYMDRLGLWGPGTSFKDAGDFIKQINSRGTGGMEMVAMDMKGRGMFMARTLSYRGAEFDVISEQLETDYRHFYNHCARLWGRMKKVTLPTTTCFPRMNLTVCASNLEQRKFSDRSLVQPDRSLR